MNLLVGSFYGGSVVWLCRAGVFGVHTEFLVTVPGTVAVESVLIL